MTIFDKKNFFEIFLDFFGYIFIDFFFDFGFFFKDTFLFLKLLGLLVKVTKVSTGHHKLSKMGQKSIVSSFLPQKNLVQRPMPSAEAELGLRSRPYLLVSFNPEVQKRVTVQPKVKFHTKIQNDASSSQCFEFFFSHNLSVTR